MPYRLQFQLAGDAPLHPYIHATGIRAKALAWIETADPDLSQQIHDANQAKPFTISPLWSTGGYRPGAIFEIAVLADTVLSALLTGIERSSDTIRLGRQTFKMDSYEITSEVQWHDFFTSPKTCVTSYEFQMLSPTAHHAAFHCGNGDEEANPSSLQNEIPKIRKSIVLPSPELYFGSYLGRWNVCCEAKFPEELLRLVERQVAVQSCEGKTQAVRLDEKRPFIGFMGAVRFAILKPEYFPQDAQQALLALARFGAFCGTGVDTMRGMGQTRFIEASGSQSK